MDKLSLRPGLIWGSQLEDVFSYCKECLCALPAVNVIGSSSINAALIAAKEAQAPIIIQFSNGGAHFNAGKLLPNEGQRAAIAGSIAGAYHIAHLAQEYGVPVILHTDHCAKKLLPWVDGLIKAGEDHYKAYGKPLYSSHMLDLSEEPLEENITVCQRYLERLHAIDMFLEMELGVTGGEEDGVDNTEVDSTRLYTQPKEVLQAYTALKEVGRFTVAAAFGNTHGVYKPGNVKLRPIILKNSQNEVYTNIHTDNPRPIHFVFHGGSGSEKEKISEAVSYGVVKFNIDTDTQWAFTRPVREYMDAKHDFLMSQVGNPEGSDKPNKKYIDPRAWLVLAEKGMKNRLIEAYKDLNAYQKFIFRYE
ncbi:hypothetical protein LSH36_583g00006 [Paralvinella palmiformis]|uniref:fructose-bisphosphate aldolase n=1 Tax=Paralvinella palmiformis TaxID=53620 RepID=A0AAD9MUY8_9ANNE|nr:hypothetical protein LSH36_583g00006 [Paralvinella palmiformis]